MACETFIIDLLSVHVNKFDTKNSSLIECIKAITWKSKKNLFSPDISFLGLPLFEILTFECKFDIMHIAITMLQIL